LKEEALYELLAELNTCIWKESIRIEHDFCHELEFPDAFKPNAYWEVNRVFKPVGQIPEGLIVYEIFIYDRWGTLLFHSKDLNIGWDGRDMNGREVQAGVYVYVVKAHETVTGRNLSDQGTVTLIR
jgi:gliding motility-associated-like protein